MGSSFLGRVLRLSVVGDFSDSHGFGRSCLLGFVLALRACRRVSLGAFDWCFGKSENYFACKEAVRQPVAPVCDSEFPADCILPDGRPGELPFVRFLPQITLKSSDQALQALNQGKSVVPS